MGLGFMSDAMSLDYCSCLADDLNSTLGLPGLMGNKAYIISGL